MSKKNNQTLTQIYKSQLVLEKDVAKIQAGKEKVDQQFHELSAKIIQIEDEIDDLKGQEKVNQKAITQKTKQLDKEKQSLKKVQQSQEKFNKQLVDKVNVGNRIQQALDKRQNEVMDLLSNDPDNQKALKEQKDYLQEFSKEAKRKEAAEEKARKAKEEQERKAEAAKRAAEEKESRQKEQREAKLAKDYPGDRDKLFNNISKIAKNNTDIELLVKSVVKIASSENKADAASSIAQTVLRGGLTALKSPRIILGTLASTPFYYSELKKIRGTDEREYMNSFFVKLANDSRTDDLLAEVLPQVGKVIENIAPDIIGAALGVLGNEEKTQHKLEDTQKKLDQFESDLEKLKQQENSKGTSDKLKNEISVLEERIRFNKHKVKELETRKGLATTIIQLQEGKFDKDYIIEAFTPVLRDVVELASQNSQDVRVVLQNGLKMARSESIDGLVEPAINILTSPLVSGVLQSKNIKNLADTHRQFLVSVVQETIMNNSILREKADTLGIEREDLANLTNAAGEIATTALQFAGETIGVLHENREELVNFVKSTINAARSIGRMIDDVKEAKVDSLDTKLVAQHLDPAIESGIKLLENEQVQKLLKIIGSVAAENDDLKQSIQGATKTLLKIFKPEWAAQPDIDQKISQAINASLEIINQGLGKSGDIVKLFKENVIPLVKTVVVHEIDSQAQDIVEKQERASDLADKPQASKAVNKPNLDTSKKKQQANLQSAILKTVAKQNEDVKAIIDDVKELREAIEVDKKAKEMEQAAKMGDVRDALFQDESEEKLSKVAEILPDKAISITQHAVNLIDKNEAGIKIVKDLVASDASQELVKDSIKVFLPKSDRKEANEELVKETVEIVSKLSSAILSDVSTKNIVNIANTSLDQVKAYRKEPDKNKFIQDRTELFVNAITSDVIALLNDEEMKSLIKDDLPQYMKKAPIVEVVQNGAEAVYASGQREDNGFVTAIAQKLNLELNKLGVEEQFTVDTTKAAVEIVKDNLLPALADVVDVVTKEEEQVKNIVSQAILGANKAYIYKAEEEKIFESWKGVMQLEDLEERQQAIQEFKKELDKLKPPVKENLQVGMDVVKLMQKNPQLAGHLTKLGDDVKNKAYISKLAPQAVNIAISNLPKLDGKEPKAGMIYQEDIDQIASSEEIASLVKDSARLGENLAVIALQNSQTIVNIADNGLKLMNRVVELGEEPKIDIKKLTPDEKLRHQHKIKKLSDDSQKEVQQLTSEVIHFIRNKGLKDTITELPEYVRKNHEVLTKGLEMLADKNEEKLEFKGLSADVVKSAGNLGLNILASDETINIAALLEKAVNADSLEKTKAQERNIAGLVNGAYQIAIDPDHAVSHAKSAFKSFGSLLSTSADYKEVKSVITESIPKLLEQNQEGIVKLMGDFLDGTEKGREFDHKVRKSLEGLTKQAVKAAGANSGLIVSMAKNYEQKNYVRFVKNVIQLSTSLEVVKFLAKAASTALTIRKSKSEAVKAERKQAKAQKKGQGR